MTDSNFKQAIRDHLDQVSLDQSQLEQLGKLQDKRTPKTNHSILFKFAAAASLIITLTFSVMQFYFDDEVLTQVVNEIAENHIRLDKIEYQSSQITEIAAHFDKLDFVPRLPEDLSLVDSRQMLGARYCSIQGEIALQLRYGDAIDESATLYIALPNAKTKSKIKRELSALKMPYTSTVKNVNVSVWYEEDLLYAVSQSN